MLVNNGFENVRNLDGGMTGLIQYIAANERKDPQAVAFLRERIVARPPIAGLLPPEIELRDMQGKSIKLARYTGEKTVVLLFWMLRDEKSLRALEAMHEITAGNDGIAFLPVLSGKFSGKRRGELDEAGRLIESLTSGRSLHTDPDRRAAAAFEVQEMPALVLIDEKGILRASGIADVHEKLPDFWGNSFADLLELAVSGEEIPYPEDPLYGNQRTPEDLEGRSAPGFTLTDGSGKQYSLGDYRGEDVVLAFWEFGCPYSRKQVALLAEYRRAHEGGIEVLSIASRPPPEQQWQFERFVREKEISFPVLFHDDEGSVARAYFLSGVPVWMVIDESGLVKAPHMGYAEDTGAILDEAIGRHSPTTDLTPR
jgi:peroxiredoxin